MEHAGAAQQRHVQLVGAQAGVGPGLAGKGEMTLSPAVQRHKRQRGEHVWGQQKAGGIDARSGEGVPQEAAVHIVAHLADKGGTLPQPGGGGQDVGGRAAGVALEELHAAVGQAAVREVDQQLAQGDDVEGGAHARASGYSLHSSR